MKHSSKLIHVVSGIIFFSFPALVHALTFADFAKKIVEILNEGIKLLIVISLVGFVWGLARFVYNAGEDRVRTQGKQLMVWGTIGLFAMVSAWSLVRIIKSIFL